MSLNTLPNELKLQILRAAPDIRTLLALDATSSSFFQVYLANKAQCLTDVTLRVLHHRNVDVLTPASAVEVRSGNVEIPEMTLSLLKVVFEDCWRHAQKGQNIRLSPRSCQALLILTECALWDLHFNLEFKWQVGASWARRDGVVRGSRRHGSGLGGPSYYHIFEMDHLQGFSFIVFDVEEFPHSRPPGSPEMFLLKFGGTNKLEKDRFLLRTSWMDQDEWGNEVAPLLVRRS